MPADSFRVIRTVQHIVKDLCRSRLKENEPTDYPTPREAMLQLHGDWQDLLLAVRRFEISDHAAIAAMRLAAAAIKFATDLGEPVMMEKIEETPWDGAKCKSKAIHPPKSRKRRSAR